MITKLDYRCLAQRCTQASHCRRHTRPEKGQIIPLAAFDLAMKCGMYIDFFGGFIGSGACEERRFTPHNHEECAEAVILAAAEIWRSRK